MCWNLQDPWLKGRDRQGENQWQYGPSGFKGTLRVQYHLMQCFQEYTFLLHLPNQAHVIQLISLIVETPGLEIDVSDNGNISNLY